jgi:hypothetical protein
MDQFEALIDLAVNFVVVIKCHKLCLFGSWNKRMPYAMS